MSGLSTKDVKTGGGGGLPKTIQPGNTSAIIHEVTLDQPAFMVKENGYFILLSLETPKPSDDFEGFMIDKDLPDSGRYDGQVGRVKGSRWAFKDGKTRGGTEISRDIEIMKFIKNLCEALGGKSQEWWDASDNKYNTIEELVEAFSTDKPFEGQSLEYCIGGRGYHNKDGYVNYDLHLPKFSKAGVPFAHPDKAGRLLEFNEADHVEQPKEKEVDSFEGDAETPDAEGDALLPSAGDQEGTVEFEL